MANLVQKLNGANEDTWLLLANLSDQLLEPEKSLAAYENVLRHNPLNVTALTQIARIYHSRQQFREAIAYYHRVVTHDFMREGQSQQNLGDIWGALGHCYLMNDDLKDAYAAYQRALYSSQAAKDSTLWYGIGILYDKCGSFDLAEEVFCHVLKIAPDFDRKDEVQFRLGMIYKHESKHDKALECFGGLLDKPPQPLSQSDIIFQIGIVYELQGKAVKAKEMYEKVLEGNPKNAKIITQLGWLYHQQGTPFHDVDKAIELMKTSVQADPTDPQPWYLLGRCFMSQKDYKNAYSAYQQAVCRDEMNPSYWCSIGVLYYQINQFRDALDAYSRSICLNPAQSEVWYDLGTLYKSCRQFSDAHDAFSKAAELDPDNPHIIECLNSLKNPVKAEDGPPGPLALKDPSVMPGAMAKPMTTLPRNSKPPLPGALASASGLAGLASLREEAAVAALAGVAAEEKQAMEVEKGSADAGIRLLLAREKEAANGQKGDEMAVDE